MEHKQSFRQAGKNPTRGRVCKGKMNDAHNRSTQPSIPSTYDVIITDDNLRDNKGFGSTRHRFGLEHNNVPGPGSYVSTRSASSSSSNQNRRGQGDFISNNKRFKPYQYTTVGPGPGRYDPTEKKMNVRTCARAFKEGMIYTDLTHCPRAPPEGPAPNEYDPENQGKNISIVSAFKSKAKREIMKADNEVPAPSDYDPKKQQGLAEPANASFKHPSYLRRYQVNLYDPHAPVAMPKNPGPGAYNLIEAPEEKTERGQRMFSYTTTDRFGKSVAPRVHDARPSPGDYQMNFVEEEPLPVSGAVFMSEADRALPKADKKPPGPAYYTTKPIQKKKTFHLNTAKNWL